jgi:UDP-glucose 4-epimerase
VSSRSALLELRKKYKITGIVYLSGASPVGNCEHMRTNVLHLLNVLEAAEQWGARRVSVASTIGVYSDACPCSYSLREDEPLPMAARHPIPAMKKIAELLGATIAKGSEFEVVNLRFGAWGPLFHHPPSPMNIFSQMVRAAVHGKKLNFSQPHSRAYADNGADLSYVKDCARAIALTQLADRLTYRTYNIGTGQATRNLEFADAIKRIIPDAIIDLPEGLDPTGPDKLLALDITRIAQDTGFKPQFDIERGINDYVEWLRAGHEW